MLAKLLHFTIAIAIFPIVFAYHMHQMMWNYVFAYLKNAFGALRTS